MNWSCYRTYYLSRLIIEISLRSKGATHFIVLSFVTMIKRTITHNQQKVHSIPQFWPNNNLTHNPSVPAIVELAMMHGYSNNVTVVHFIQRLIGTRTLLPTALENAGRRGSVRTPANGDAVSTKLWNDSRREDEATLKENYDYSGTKSRSIGSELFIQKRTSVPIWSSSTYKGKAIPLQAWSGPEGSRKLRFPDFMTTAQDGGKVVSLTHRPPLPPGC